MEKSYWEWEPVFNINPNESALLIVDMQNGFLEKDSSLEVPMARKQIPVFKKLISFCRKTKIPVIYTTFCVRPDFHYNFYWNIAKQRGLKIDEPDCDFWDGKSETDIYSELSPLSNEKLIKKYGYDCFAETTLENDLSALGVSNIIVTGTVLNWCVDSTVRSAYHRHYNVTVISDAVSTYDHAGGTAEEWHTMELNLFAEAFSRVITADNAIEEMIKFSK